MSLYLNSDNNLEWTGAKDEKTGAFLNAATITYAIKTLAVPPVTIAGGTGTLTYTPASDGDYLAVVDATVTAPLTPGEQYAIEMTLVQGNYNDFRRWIEKARYRETM